MSNANFTPIGPNKKWWPKVDFEGSTNAGPPRAQGNPTGQAQVQRVATNACRKCGYTGHLAYQCRNFIQLKPNHKVDVDVSSTSSEEYETHLRTKDEERRRRKAEKAERREKRRLRKEERRSKEERKKEKDSIKRHRSHRHSSPEDRFRKKSSEDSPSHKRRRHHEEKERRDRHRRRSSS